MPTNQDQLDQGPPAIDPGVDPTTLPTEEQQQWGAAFVALLGTRGTDENAFGSALLRVPVLQTVAVAANTVTLSVPGAVTCVRSRVGTLTGGMVLIPDGTPASGEVRVTYDSGYIPTLLFNAADAVTSCSLSQLQIPAAFVEMMQASNPA